MLLRLGLRPSSLTRSVERSAGVPRRWQVSAFRSVALGTHLRATPLSSSLGAVRGLETGDTPVLNAFRNPKPDPLTGRLLALGQLRPAPGARKPFLMLGRGEGSRKGKSAGRGMRGTYHRRALRKRNFEGGQTPQIRRIPNRGHAIPPVFQERFTEVSVGQLQYYAQTGRIDATKPIQLKHLLACGHKPDKSGIKIVGAGAERLVIPLHVEVSRTDELAKYAIEQSGGSVKLVYFTRLGMRAHLYPERFAILPATTNVPPPKKRFHYVPYDLEGRIPPLLFKSRLTASSPLSKYWTPSPVASAYLKAVAQRDARRAQIAAELDSAASDTATTPSPPSAPSAKPAKGKGKGKATASSQQ